MHTPILRWSTGLTHSVWIYSEKLCQPKIQVWARIHILCDNPACCVHNGRQLTKKSTCPGLISKIQQVGQDTYTVWQPSLLFLQWNTMNQRSPFAQVSFQIYSRLGQDTHPVWQLSLLCLQRNKTNQKVPMPRSHLKNTAAWKVKIIWPCNHQSYKKFLQWKLPRWIRGHKY